MLQVAEELKTLAHMIMHEEISFNDSLATLEKINKYHALDKYPLIRKTLTRIIKYSYPLTGYLRDARAIAKQILPVIEDIDKIVVNIEQRTPAKIIEITPEETKNKLTGGSTSYYKLHISNPIHFDAYDCECGDIIEALNMTFNEGEAFKAIWRMAAARLGGGKKDADPTYDSEKIKYFGERILKNAIINPTENIFKTQQI